MPSHDARLRRAPAAISGASHWLVAAGEMGALMRQVDWACTPVGALEHWPQSLRTAAGLMLESKQATLLAWGPELTQLYNDAFRPLLGETRSPVLGRGARETFLESWNVIGPLIERVRGGEAAVLGDVLVPLEHGGRVEEHYFDYQCAPVRDESGGVGGVQITLHETTARVLAERRLATLHELTRCTASAPTESTVWQAAADVLAQNPLDVPFAFQYRVEPGGTRARLVAGRASALSPAVILLGRDEPGSWPLDPRLEHGVGVLLHDVSTRFGHHTGPRWPEPVREALIVPVARRGLARLYGFLVLGVSPRSRLDRDYRDFLARLADPIAAAVSGARTTRAAARLELARARADAASARARREAQLMQAPVGVAVLRCPELRYELANPLYLDMVGRRNLLGKTVREVFPELPAAAPLFRMLDDVYASGEPFSVSDFRLTEAGGGRSSAKDAYYNLSCQPLRDDAGNVVEIICVALDVTPEVLARQRIQSLLEELQIADQRKDEFLATLAHELRNPMAAISTALSLLDSAELDVQKAPGYLEAARRQMNNLVRLVDDLLDVARITRGKIELRKEPLDLGRVIEHAVEATRPTLEARRHTLSVEIEPAPLRVFADATRIEQIVVNLLTNAAKYTEPEGHVSVRLSREPGGSASGPDIALIRVKDTGRGIPRAMLGEVFDLFTQVSPSIDRSTGGLGLGLTLVKHLTEMHGGSVAAHSDGPGAGSEFFIRLPCMAYPDNPSSQAPQPSPPPSDDAGTPGQRRTGRRVLVVEDSDDVRELLAECVRSLGHEVHLAADGIEGTERFASVRPEIALLDVGLPGIDGYEVARRIRAQPGGDAAHLVALTGYGGAEVRREAERAGFNLQLTKPIDIQGLMQIFASYEAKQKA